MKHFFVLCLALCLICVPCLAQELSAAAAPATLTAVGLAEVEVQNDYGILNFALEVSAQTVTQAQDQMDAMISSLCSVLNDQGIPDTEIRSADYEVHGVYEYNYTKFSEQRLLEGYSVQATLQVHVEDAGKAAVIIATADEAGVNCSYDLVFETRDDPSAYDKALEMAAREALRKAQVLAQASGLTLDALVSIQETENANQAVVKVTYTVK